MSIILNKGQAKGLKLIKDWFFNSNYKLLYVIYYRY